MNYSSSPKPLPPRSAPPSTHAHCSGRLLFHSLSPPMAASIASSIVLLPQKAYSFPRKFNPRKSSTGISRRTPPAITASSSFRNGSQPETECPVPFEQQPVNEYQSLSTSFLFSWATADLREYYSRLALTGASFAILVGLPVAAFGTGAASSAPIADALRCGLGAASAGLLAVTLAVLRMYLGWAYVGNRLLSATVEYEETGWYDGQIWAKTPEVLARDRLLGSFSVKPVLTRVKFTLVGLAVSLAVCVILFINVENPRNTSDNASGKVIDGVYNDAAARSFEPDAFCREPDLS